jgi:anticodon-binding protein/uncharacterized protein DUF835
MRPTPNPRDPVPLEEEIRTYWAGRHLPEADGILPPTGGAANVTVIASTIVRAQESAPETIHRLLLADIAARFVRVSGKGMRPDVAMESDRPEAAAGLDAALDRLGIWFGRTGRRAALERPAGDAVQRAIDRLAAAELLVARSIVQRFCPFCAEVRTPQRVRYQDEFGRAYLIRVPLAEPAPAASLIVWTEAVWKLLSTTAILLNPDVPYVRASFKRRGIEEQILIAKAALPRLEEWMPGGEITILEERPGSAWAGRRYRSPLAESVPALGSAEPPVGTIQATPEVNDTGTGMVALTPAHGPADALLARTLRFPANDVLRADGTIGGEPRHKYTGLPLDTAEACLLRDLLDDGYIFAELRVRRGVPHCMVCDRETVWRPGLAWSVDLGKIPTAVSELYARLLPEEPLPSASELLAWPVSDGRPSEAASSPVLRQCPACGRLSPSTSTGACQCGRAAPVPARQELRPPFEEPLLTWLRIRSAPPIGPVWLFLPARRRAPALFHHLLVAWATGPVPARELRIFPISALPVSDEPHAASTPPAADAERIAYLRFARRTDTRQGFAEAVAGEARWVRRIWELTRSIQEGLARDGVPLSGTTNALRLADLFPEDLAFLARFERLRGGVIAEYEHGEWESGFNLMASFIDRELRDGYLRLVRPRRVPDAPAPSRLAVDRVLAHLLVHLSQLLAPVMPFTAEALHRDSSDGEQSVFEQRLLPVQEALLDADAERSLPVWEGLVASLERCRKQLRFEPGEVLPQLVLVALQDDDAARLLPQIPLLTRIAHAQKVEVYGPSRPWTQRRVLIRFDREAIRQAYPVYYRRMLSVLETLEPKRVREALRTQTLAVAVEGQPAIRVPASMVEVVETLPDRFVSFPWTGGEAYVELPSRISPSSDPSSAHLPAEVERVATHLRWRLRELPEASTPAKAFISASEPLRSELQRHVGTLSARSGIVQILPVDSSRLFVPGETSYGRTRRGQEWLVWLPGARTPTRNPKRRARREDAPIQIASATVLPAGVKDFLADEEVGRVAGVRELLAALDARSGSAAVGATKLGYAWEAGFHTLESMATAEPAALAAVPGFGPALAWSLVQSLAPDRVLPPLPSLQFATPVLEEPEQPAPGVAPDPGEAASRAELANVGPALVPPPAPIELAQPLPGVAPAPPLSRATPRTAAPTPRAAPPEVRFQPPEPPAEPVREGGVQLHATPSSEDYWDQFLAQTGDGAAGLWVGRVFPPALRAAGASADIRFLWLSAANRPNSVRPTDLAALEAGILSEAEQHRVSAVMFQEVEYLVTLNGPEAVADRLRSLNGHARRLGVTIWVPLSPELLPEDQIAVLRAALTTTG